MCCEADRLFLPSWRYGEELTKCCRGISHVISRENVASFCSSMRLMLSPMSDKYSWSRRNKTGSHFVPPNHWQGHVWRYPLAILVLPSPIPAWFGRWRRFTFHLEFDFPDFGLRKQIIESFLNRMKSAMVALTKHIFTSLKEEYKKNCRKSKRNYPSLNGRRKRISQFGRTTRGRHPIHNSG